MVQPTPSKPTASIRSASGAAFTYIVTTSPQPGLPPGMRASASSSGRLWRGRLKWSTSNAMRVCRSKRCSFRGSALDRRAHRVAPLGPGAVVVADVPEAQQVGQHEPRVRRPLADPAIRDDLVVRTESVLLLVDRAQLRRGPERVRRRVHRPRPRNVLRPGDVAAPQRTLVRV